MTEPWAFVRQVVLATTDPDTDIDALRAAYRLPAGFTDPELAEHGIADRTIPTGPEQFLEVIAPSSPSSPLHAWLGRLGGRAGYGLAVQVPDMAAIRDRAASLGVRIVIDQEARGHRIMQLHPGDVGILLDLDESADRNWWFWDDISDGPAPDAIVDGVVEIEVCTPDPERMAALWSTLLGVDRPTATAVDLGTTIRFVGGDHRGVRAVTLRLTDRAPSVVDDAEMFGITFRHVAG